MNENLLRHTVTLILATGLMQVSSANSHHTSILTYKGANWLMLMLGALQQTQVLPINFGWAIAEWVNLKPLKRTKHACLTGVIMLHYRKHYCGGTPNVQVARI